MSGAQVSVRVQAGLERAFDVFTGELGDWWRAHPLFATTPRAPGRLALLDPGPAGRLVETLPDGRAFELGRVLAWERPSRLRLSWRPASFDADQATEIEVTFAPVGDATRVTVTHAGWERVPAAHVARHGFPEAALLRRLGEWWTTQLRRYEGRVPGAWSAGAEGSA